MYTLSKEGKTCTADKGQLEALKKAGWSLGVEEVAPEVEVEVEAEAEKPEVAAKPAAKGK